MIELLFLLITKHFIVDFILQTPAQVKYKGVWAHPVGFSHSLEQGIWTAVALCFYVDIRLAAAISYCELMIHYITDYTKMKYGCRDTNQKIFWVQLGIDQYVHYLTYFGIVYFLQKVLAL